MPIYHGGTEIPAGALKIGGSDVSSVYWGSILVWPPSVIDGGRRLLENGTDRRALENGFDLRVTEDAARSFSPEVQAVLDRMTELTAEEIDAIEAFVDGSVADGNWGRIDDFWCFALNGTDWLTGWKFTTAIPSGTIARSSNGATCTDTSSDIDTTMILDSLVFHQLGDSEIGVFLHQIDSFGTSEVDLFGCQTDVGNYRTRLRHLGDTETTPEFSSTYSGTTTWENTITLGQMQKKLFSLRDDGIRSRLLINGSVQLPDGDPGTNLVFEFPLSIFRCNDAGTPQRSSRPSTVTSCYVGAVLNSTAFFNRLTTLHTALGVS